MSWYKRFDLGSSTGNSSLVLTPDGQLVAGGFLTKASAPNASNAWIVSLDLMGDLNWSKEYQQAEAYREVLSDMLLLDDGSLLGLGQASNDSSTEGMLMNVAPNGDLNWVRGIHHTNSQFIVGGQVLPNGQLFLRGSFGTSIFALTTTSEAESYCSDAPLNLTARSLAIRESILMPTADTPNIGPMVLSLQVSSSPITENLICSGIVGVSSEEPQFSVQVFPNPCQDLLHVKLPPELAPPFRIWVMNALGQEIYPAVNQQVSELQLDLSSMPAGPYWLSLISGDRRYQQTFLKQ